MITNPVLRVSAPDDQGVRSFWMWCPACDDAVRIVDGPNGWGWNGDLERPTFTPSILITGAQWDEGSSFRKPRHSNVAPGERIACHSFLTDGVWHFLGDCTHGNAGQYVPMVPLPDWMTQPD